MEKIKEQLRHLSENIYLFTKDGIISIIFLLVLIGFAFLVNTVINKTCVKKYKELKAVETERNAKTLKYTDFGKFVEKVETAGPEVEKFLESPEVKELAVSRENYYPTSEITEICRKYYVDLKDIKAKKRSDGEDMVNFTLKADFSEFIKMLADIEKNFAVESISVKNSDIDGETQI